MNTMTCFHVSMSSVHDALVSAGRTRTRTRTRNSKLETRNSKLETRNSKLETRNSKLETRNSKLETRNSKLETRNSNASPTVRVRVRGKNNKAPAKEAKRPERQRAFWGASPASGDFLKIPQTNRLVIHTAGKAKKRARLTHPGKRASQRQIRDENERPRFVAPSKG